MSNDTAIYSLEMRIEFRGCAPQEHNSAAPEIVPICDAAVAAARRVLTDADYEVAVVGHGSKRLDPS